MKDKTILVFLTLCWLALTAERLPMFIGRGYNIFKGNPINYLGADKGFTYPVLKLEYEGATTEDGRYEIPRSIYSTKHFSCLRYTSAFQHSGTKSYQNSLKTFVTIRGG